MTDLRKSAVLPGMDLRDLGVLRVWSQRYKYQPNQLAIDYSTDEAEPGRVEIMSWPYWEGDILCIKVRAPGDPTTIRTVEWPQLVIVPLDPSDLTIARRHL